MLRRFAWILVPALVSAPAFAGRIELLSSADPVGPPKPIGEALSPALSGDGRWVAFTSNAPNLVPGQQDPFDSSDVFLRDRTTGETILVSRRNGSVAAAGNSSSYDPRISSDGRWLAFCSYADNLVADQVALSAGQVFLYDRILGTNTLVSHLPLSPFQGGNGTSCLDVTISDDGRFVAFASQAGDLVASAGPQVDYNVYLFDRDTGALTLLSHAAGSPAQLANGTSSSPTLSANGQRIAYRSRASDLVAGVTDANGEEDVFLYDRTGGTTTLVSHAAGSPLVSAGSWSFPPQISADGAWVLFQSRAANLVTGQSDSGTPTTDVFLWEPATGSTRLVTHAHGSPATTANGNSWATVLSRDGSSVVFASDATDLVSGVTDANGSIDLFHFDLSTGATILISHAAGFPGSTGSEGSGFDLDLSADGSRAIFQSGAPNLIAGMIDANGEMDLFTWDRATGDVKLASHVPGSPAQTAGGFFFQPTISADGRLAAFMSDAPDLAGPSDENGGTDVFLHELATGANTALSYSPAVSSSTAAGRSELLSEGAVSSADGRFVVFLSAASNLVPGQVDNNQGGSAWPERRDVFLYDRTAQSTTLVSRSAASPAATGNDESRAAAISLDGRFVAFTSQSTNLIAGQVDVANTHDVFVFDRTTGTNWLVSHTGSSPAQAICSSCDFPQISGDGRFVAYSDSIFIRLYDRVNFTTKSVLAGLGSRLKLSDDGRYLAFTSTRPDMIPGQSDPNNGDDVFLFDRVTETIVLVSRNASSSTTAGNGAVTSWPWISADGRYVAFAGRATNHVFGQADGNGGDDVFLFDRIGGTLSLVSHAAASSQATGNGISFLAGLSKDGRFLTLLSAAADLVPGQQDTPHPTFDSFLFDRLAGTMALVSHRAGSLVATGNRGGGGMSISSDGSRLAFWSDSTDLIDGLGDDNQTTDLFLYDRFSGSLELVSRTLDSPGATANAATRFPRMSEDGRVVFFPSPASDLVADDFNFEQDVFAFVPEEQDFHTLEPCRLFDSRRPEDGPALNSGFARVVEHGGACGIPATAKALAVNVTVIQPGSAGYLTLYPGDGLPPLASTLTFGTGETRTNNSTVRLAPSGNGTLAIRPALAGGGGVHVAVDVFGFFE